MMATMELPLGPFTIDQNGLLRPNATAGFPAFRVNWRTRTVHTRLVPATDAQDCGHLEFSGRMGRVPSTAGEHGPAMGQTRRDNALGMMCHLPHLVPNGWVLNLSPDHSVTVATTTPITLPISAVSLISKLTQFLLALAPYLDVLEAEGVTPAAGGIVKT